MRPSVCWIEVPIAGRLAIMPRPRAGDWLEDEISGWRGEGIDLVVSLLETSEVAELGLDEEVPWCARHAIEVISFPSPDRGVPASLRETITLTRTLATQLRDGKAIAVHCRSGIGRSALIAACALVWLGICPATAFDLIGKARGLQVPDTEEQRDWAVHFQASIRHEALRS
jgi:protein-tyrosine phosphatase